MFCSVAYYWHNGYKWSSFDEAESVKNSPIRQISQNFFTVQHVVLQYSTVNYYTTAQYGTIQFIKLLYCTELYSKTVQYSTVEYSRVQYSTVEIYMALTIQSLTHSTIREMQADVSILIHASS